MNIVVVVNVTVILTVIVTFSNCGVDCICECTNIRRSDCIQTVDVTGGDY